MIARLLTFWFALPIFYISLLSCSEPQEPSQQSEQFDPGKLAEEKIYHDRRLTFFCGCPFTSDTIRQTNTCKNYASSAAEPKTNPANLQVAWRPLVPPSALGWRLTCWGQHRTKRHAVCLDDQGQPLSPVACCEKVNPEFRAAYRDLVNWVPTLAHFSNDQGELPFDNTEGTGVLYGLCTKHFTLHTGNPSPALRGEIARIQLFMFETHGRALSVEVSQDYLKRLYAWSSNNAPTEWEKQRNARICQAQGEGNFFVGECPRESQKQK